MPISKFAIVVWSLFIASGGSLWAAEKEQAALSSQAKIARAMALRKDTADKENLLLLLRDPDAMARRYAIYGLERLRDSLAASKVNPLLADPDPWVARAAAKCLDRLKGKTSVPAFKPAHDSEDVLIGRLGGNPSEAQQDAAVALGLMKSKNAVPELIRLLASEWYSTRRIVIEALGRIGDPRAVDELNRIMSGPDPGLRRTAAEALEKIDGVKRSVAFTAPAAVIPELKPGELKTPGNKRPPQFIVLGIDDCDNIEGLEALLDIVETLHEHGSKAVFTIFLAPLAETNPEQDVVKEALLLQRLFDLGCEIANHTLHHNPNDRHWMSLPREKQVEEIEGAVEWYRANLEGFTHPFSYKEPGGGEGEPIDPEFSHQLLRNQNMLYSIDDDAHPNRQSWPALDEGGKAYSVLTVMLDGNAPPVHEEITRPIGSDYSGKFDYEIHEGVAMLKANFEYHYNHPQRPPFAFRNFHEWSFVAPNYCFRNEKEILKRFLLDVLVENEVKYPDVYSVTYRQMIEYVRTEGDLVKTLAIGNDQDSRKQAVNITQDLNLYAE